MLRPWFAALALAACGLCWLLAFAWGLQFHPPALVAGLARAADNVRLPAVAATLHRESAEMHRRHVRHLREIGASEIERRAARFALGSRLRSAALIMHREGDTDLADRLLGEAIQAAPERSDLRSLRVDLRTRDDPPDTRRVELLRIVDRYDDPLAHYLVAEGFIAEGNDEAARGYLVRAAGGSTGWADPHLALAKLYTRAGMTDEALTSAREAFASGHDLRGKLAAADLLQHSGGQAPERLRLIARHLSDNWAPLGLLVAAFVLLFFSPALGAFGRQGLKRARDLLQRDIPDSAS